MADSPQVIEKKNKIKITYNELAPSLQSLLDSMLDSKIAESTAILIEKINTLDPDLRLFAQYTTPVSNIQTDRTMWLDTTNNLYNAHANGGWIKQRLVYF